METRIYKLNDRWRSELLYLIFHKGLGAYYSRVLEMKKELDSISDRMVKNEDESHYFLLKYPGFEQAVKNDLSVITQLMQRARMPVDWDLNRISNAIKANIFEVKE